MNGTLRVRRVFTAKRAGCDVEAQGILKDLRENLKQTGLTGVRIYNRYDIAGITDEEYGLARNQVFAELPVDDVYDEVADYHGAAALVAIEALPGQYDQRADSAAQCIQIITQKERPQVRTARIIALYGEPAGIDTERVRDYLINPVESREAALTKPQTLDEQYEAPAPVETLDGFVSLDAAGLEALIAELGLAMSFADLEFIQANFRREQREPTMTEIRVLDTYWSDHCRHTTFLTEIESVRFDQDRPFGELLAKVWRDYEAQRAQLYSPERLAAKPPCLMDLATLAMKQLRRDGYLADLDDSGEINACSIKVTIPVDGKDTEYLVMFKNETHNHPTEIEPFGGAATCLGGAIRDPLSGRTYVYQAMRVTGSGDPTVPIEETLRGKLPQRKITTTAAAGYSSYGNQIGLATGQVDECYHPGYIAKRMEIGAVIGAAPAAQIRREQPQPGDVVILLGGRTGRDGCGGATGSSKPHTEASLAQCGSEVQKGNPPTERKIQRLFRDPDVAYLIRRCNDFGAGGVSVAIGELADGLVIDLDKVPLKYEGLDGTEIAISESQERMAVVVAPGDVAAFLAAADKENLEATAVAQVSAEPRLIMNWQGQTIVNLSRAFIDTNGAPQSTRVHVTLPENICYFQRPAEGAIDDHFGKSVRNIFGSLQGCSRQGLAERFDSTIGAGTILMPFGGSCQRTAEEGMAALIPVPEGETTACTLMAYGFDPYLSSWSPYHGAYYAVTTALARIAALGGKPRQARLTLQEYFERLTSEEKWGKPLAALLGAHQAQLDYKVPAIGGKDSMSGSFDDLHVPPTLVAFAVNVTSAEKVRSATLPRAGLTLLRLSPQRDAFELPDPEAFLAGLDLVGRADIAASILAAGVVQGNGAAVTAIQMCFGERLGLDIDDEWTTDDLFRPDHGALILAVESPAAIAALEAGGARRLGMTTTEPQLVWRKESLPLADAIAASERVLEPIFPTKAEADAKPFELPLKSHTGDSDVKNIEMAPSLATYGDAIPMAAPEVYKRRPAGSRSTVMTGIAKPRVLIPVFPGTNCEYDSARAFIEAGAEADVLIVRNLTSSAIVETLAELDKRLRQAQMLMLPGGFSGGDEPEGSGKFIASAFRNPRVTEAVRDLLRRDGLILGICNGFQALIKLGLLPFGDIVDLKPDSPTLTFNRIGRHISRLVTTKVISNRSPWLAGVEPGQLHVIPASHGEGRFIASSAQVAQLAAAGQISTQYVDLEGNPSNNTRYNPNGSIGGVEGLISPDGRILGKMAHSERIGPQLYRNVPGDKDQQIFRSGVQYFL